MQETFNINIQTVFFIKKIYVDLISYTSIQFHGLSPVFSYSKEPERKVEVAPEEEDNNPFAEDTDETPSPSQEDSPRQMNGKEGVPVRALYDYTVTEEDELPLKAGEFLHKGEGCWDWCVPNL